jgi:hypothetical protein
LPILPQPTGPGNLRGKMRRDASGNRACALGKTVARISPNMAANAVPNS